MAAIQEFMNSFATLADFAKLGAIPLRQLSLISSIRVNKTVNGKQKKKTKAELITEYWLTYRSGDSGLAPVDEPLPAQPTAGENYLRDVDGVLIINPTAEDVTNSSIHASLTIDAIDEDGEATADPVVWMGRNEDAIISGLTTLRNRMGDFKMHASLTVLTSRGTEEEPGFMDIHLKSRETIREGTARSKHVGDLKTMDSENRANSIILRSDDLKEVFENFLVANLSERMGHVNAQGQDTEPGSNYKIEKIIMMKMTAYKINPIVGARGGAYENTYKPLPRAVANRKATLNIVNSRDSKCFGYCIQAYTDPEISYESSFFSDDYPLCKELQNLDYPVSADAKTIRAIEDILKINIYIYVLDEHNKLVMKVRSKGRWAKANPCDLLLYEFHYILITDLSKMLGGKRKNKCWVCRNCFCVKRYGGSGNTSSIKSHIRICNGYHTNTFCKKDETDTVTYKHKPSPGIVVYADFECYSGKDVKQTINSYGFKVFYEGGDRYYADFGGAGDFVKTLFEACDILAVKDNMTIPVLFHNGTTYDFKMLMDWMFKNMPSRNMRVLPAQLTKYKSVTYRRTTKTRTFMKTVKTDDGRPYQVKTKVGYNLTFMDSYAHLKSPLCDFKVEGLWQMAVAQGYIKPGSEELSTGKLPYFYEMIKDRSCFEQEDYIPVKADFYSTMGQKDITDEDYELFLKLIDVVIIKEGSNLIKSLHWLYLYFDVGILAYTFQDYRANSITAFDVDPINYVSAPSFSYAIFTKGQPQVRIISDEDQFEFFDQPGAVRGGYTAVSKKKIAAGDGEICYVDVNSLYPFAMMQKMPVDNYVLHDEKSQLVWRINEGGEIPPCFLEVDLECPPELHETFKEFPLFPHLTDKPKVGDKPQGKALIADFNTRTRYVTYYKNLLYGIQKGWKLKQVHRVFTFKEDYIFKDFVTDLSTRRGASGASDEDKALYKLIMNSLYGKTLVNKAKQISVKLLSATDFDTEKEFIDAAVEIQTDCRFARAHYFTGSDDRDTAAVFKMNRATIKQNTLKHVGCAILELSKLHMWTLWYDVIKPVWKDAEMVYTDTDSIIFKVGGKFFDLMTPELSESYFDFSDILKWKVKIEEKDPEPVQDPNIGYLFPKNKKKVGLLKLEFPPRAIIEGIFLAPKTYTLRFNNGRIVNKGKGAKIENCIDDNGERLNTGHYDKVLAAGSGKSISFKNYKFVTDLRDKADIRIKSQRKKVLSNSNTKGVLNETTYQVDFGGYISGGDIKNYKISEPGEFYEPCKKIHAL